jgi:CelD/BcsL family acetyltransferase involved in cellulose biosynthesis
VETAARALRQILRRPPRRFQLFVGRHLSGADDWASLLGAKPLREVANPVLPLRGATWDDVLATFSAKLRREIRYDVRRLEREHAVDYRRSDDPASLREGLDVLFRLHAIQWRERSYFLGHEEFHREFAAIAQERGWLRLWIVEADGSPVAAKYNFRFGDAELSYQAGRDPEWRGASLGLVNVMNAMRAAFEEGVREYRFLRGSERYKFRFPVVDAGLHTVARGSGVLGRTALAAGAALDREALQAARRTVTRHANGIAASS